jgi:MFS family permease
MSFEVPARQALVYDLAGAEHITNALALHSSVFNLARFAGPAIAGILMSSGFTYLCFYIKAISALVIIMCLFKIRHRYPSYNLISEKNDDNMTGIGSVRITLQYIFSVPVIVKVLLLVLSFGVLLLPYSILLPSLGRDVLGLGAREYGFLGAANGCGALAGAVFVAMFGNRENRQRWWWAGAFMFPMSLFMLSLASSYLYALLLLFVSGTVMVITSTSAISLIQLNATDEMRGKIMGLFSMCFMGFFPVGSLLQGWLAGVAGVRATMMSASALAFLLVIIVRCGKFPERPS